MPLFGEILPINHKQKEGTRRCFAGFLPKSIAEMLTFWKLAQDFLMKVLMKTYTDCLLVFAGAFGFLIEVSWIREALKDHMLHRNFQSKKPNQKWATDVTEFNLLGQKLYLSSILNLHNGYIVSSTISEPPVLRMAIAMRSKASASIPDGTNLIFHSDQGWQYQHKLYQRLMKAAGIRQSMRRKGNCSDRAVVENCFGLFKSELLYLEKFESMKHFR